MVVIVTVEGGGGAGAFEVIAQRRRQQSVSRANERTGLTFLLFPEARGEDLCSDRVFSC